MNARRALGILSAIVDGVMVIAYPIAVGYGLLYLPARAVSLGVLALLVPTAAWRLRHADRATFWTLVRLPLSIACLVTVGAVTGDGRFVRAMPVLVSAALLAQFSSTLRPGQTPMIERFARMQHPDLGPVQVAHCRRWTTRWCAFFVVNGLTALTLALAAPVWWWTVYTGAVAYALMGLMFVVERLGRPRPST